MNSFFNVLPQEIIQKNIHTQLDLHDALSVTELCQLSNGLGLSNEFWVDLLFKKYGITVHPDKAFQKFLLLYYFDKFVAYAMQYNLWGKSQESLHKRSFEVSACRDYFDKAANLLEELGAINPIDVGWTSYVKGVMGFYNPLEQNTFLETLTLLKASSDAGYTPATMLYACINLGECWYEMRAQRLQDNLSSMYVDMGIQLDFATSHIPLRATLIVDPTEGLALLNDAYQKKKPEAAVVLAILNWCGENQTLGIPANKEKAINILSADFCAQDRECLLMKGKFLKRLWTRSDQQVGQLSPALMINAFTQAAGQGSADAAAELRLFYVAEKDEDNASVWLKRAAELGDMEAVWLRNPNYFSGVTAENIVLAIKNFEIGASTLKVDKQSIATKNACLLALFAVYSSGKHGIKPDLIKASRMLARAAKTGAETSVVLRGLLYAVGHSQLGLQPNAQKAEEYFDSLLFSPVFASAESAAARIVYRSSLCPFATDQELMLRFRFKWVLRYLKLSNMTESSEKLITQLEKLQRQMPVKDKAAYDSLHKLQKEMFAIKFDDPDTPYFEDNLKKDLTPIAVLLHQAFGIPFTPDKFLLPGNPLEALQAKTLLASIQKTRSR